jgi:hypothetical protein
MSWVGGGIFSPLIHQIDEGADTMLVGDGCCWWSRCTRLSNILPDSVRLSDIEDAGWCGTCFPDYMAKAMAIRTNIRWPPSVQDESVTPRKRCV